MVSELALGVGSRKLQASLRVTQAPQGTCSLHFTRLSLHRLHPFLDLRDPSCGILIVQAFTKFVITNSRSKACTHQTDSYILVRQRSIIVQAIECWIYSASALVHCLRSLLDLPKRRYLRYKARKLRELKASILLAYRSNDIFDIRSVVATELCPEHDEVRLIPNLESDSIDETRHSDKEHRKSI